MWFGFTRFFFFKQKTAYELRISDWSSDVCSSDLIWRATTETQAATAAWRNDEHIELMERQCAARDLDRGDGAGRRAPIFAQPGIRNCADSDASCHVDGRDRPGQ